MIRRMRLSWIGGALFGSFCLAIALAIAASTACTVRAADPKAGDKAGEKPGDSPVAKTPEAFVVPDGTPEKLSAYIEDLMGRQPEGVDPIATRAFRVGQLQAVRQAAAKMLAGKPTEDQAFEAVRYAVTALSALQELGDKAAPAQLAAYPGELTKLGLKQLAREVSGFLLDNRLQDIQTAGPEQLQALVGDLKKFLEEGTPGPADAQLAMSAASELEFSDNAKLAADAYGSFGKVLSASKDADLAQAGKKMENASLRLGLVGKDMPLEGAFVDGAPLDWAKYRGKVVLVQFWATWCGPCREEIVNIRRNYDLYHDRGFDVIGISCDDDRRQLDLFLKENELPWNSLFSDDPKATGMETPMAMSYGVMGLPTLILVDAKGKVVSLQARGPKLGAELAKLLGPAESGKAAGKEAAPVTAVEQTR